MNVNGITTQTAAYAATETSEKKTADKKSAASDKSEAAVYESTAKSDKDSSKKIYSQDLETVNRLKEDLARRKLQLMELVQKSLGQQADTSITAASIRQVIEDGVDPEVVKQAQEDISEDGYWGVEKTSDRLVNFAIALSGGNPDKADEMIAAIQEGFSQAAGAWGEDLPELCQKTYDATMEKLDAWKNSVTEEV
ncbi:hypothetical protein [Anaeromicropila populeti]|uniref:Uncharacterized protein n=1 Tax=Anaeromicropila populeti TaxID=37658 RepID=A0A1I6IQC9_9FIRM|nr:hypothetical protein [Anaeromicropila populeti]SFR68942.1 hypothetical protein SAMN05661086_01032 [Anaeromicropila populeti]